MVPRRKVQVKDSYHVGSTVVAQVWYPTRVAALQAEKRLHGALTQFRALDVSGREWFYLTQTLVDQFTVWAQQSSNSLPLRAAIKSGRYTDYQATQLIERLNTSMPFVSTVWTKKDSNDN
jgi:hypothetical protein